MKKLLNIYSLSLICAIAMASNSYAEVEDEIPALTGIEEDPAPLPAPEPVEGEVATAPNGEQLPSISQGQPTDSTTPDGAAPQATAPDNLPSMTREVAKQIERKQETEVKDAKLLPPNFTESLMFDETRIAELKKVYESVNSRRSENTEFVDDQSNFSEIMDNFVSAEPKKVPQGIYLNSIFYRSAENASVWINGKKYEVGTEADNIKVIEITPNTAKLQWRAKGYEIDFSGWKDTFPKIEDIKDEKEVSKLPPSKRTIEVDPKTETIEFVLKPNQHLDFMNKNVREGKPVVVAEAGTGAVSSELTYDPQTGLAKAIKDAPGKLADALAGKNEKPIDGKEDAVDIGDNSATAQFAADEDRHYYIPVEMDGYGIRFKVDTGATEIIISSDDAKKMGIDIDRLVYNKPGTIADGSTMLAAEVMVKSFRVKQLEFDNMKILVAKGSFAEPLLGMPFFDRVTSTFDNGTLTITKK